MISPLFSPSVPIDFLGSWTKSFLFKNLHICMYFREWKFMSRCHLLCMARSVWKIRIFVYLDNLSDIATLRRTWEKITILTFIIQTSFSLSCRKFSHFLNAQALCCERSYCLWAYVMWWGERMKSFPCALLDYILKLAFIIISAKVPFYN